MKNKFSFSVFAISILFSLFIQFYELGNMPVVQWDESRLAVNAAEMSRSGDCLITTFEWKPDLYNTKPPLMIWFQVLSIRLFGLNEWSVRFPSALFGIMTILLAGLFVYRISKNYFAASVATMILASSHGFIQLHGSMTGDYDAMLTFFLTLSIYHCYRYFETGKQHHLFFLTIDLALALMTKSAAALIFFPVIMALFYHYSGFKNWGRLSLVLLTSLIPMIVFWVVRENMDHGYLEAMWENDMGGRFINGKDGHEGPWNYYIVQLFSTRFGWLIWLLPLSVFWGVYMEDKTLNALSAVLLCYLFVVSAAKTKLEWYDLPLLPVISMMVALLLNGVYAYSKSTKFKKGFVLLLISGILWSAYGKLIFSVSGKYELLNKEVYAVSEIIRHHEGPWTMSYYSAQYSAWNYFYTLSNPYVEKANPEKLAIGQKIVLNNAYSDSITYRCRTITLDSNQYAKTLQITGIY